MAKLRLGIAELLESRALAWGFLKGHYSDFFQVSRHPPGRISQLLAAGELDAGLVPALDLAWLEGVSIVPDVGVSAPGESASALLLHSVPIDEIETVAFDSHGRSGLLLAEVVLRSHGVKPRFEERVVVEERMPDCDATLLLGERALRASWEDIERTSLTAEWHRLTGTPWVSFVWAIRDSVKLPDINFYFKSSLRYGLSSMNALSRESGAELDVRINRVEEYLSKQLRFVLSEVDGSGLDASFQQASALGLIDSVPELTYL